MNVPKTIVSPIHQQQDNDQLRQVVGAQIILSQYPSGEPMVRQLGREDSAVGLVVQTTSVGDLMTALFWVDAYHARSSKLMSLRLVLPYVPGARQDRINPEGDYLFTARSVAREINAREFDEVVVADPHSEVITALIDRCRVVRCDEFVNPPEGKYSAVIAPDGGAEKRAGAVAKKLGVPLKHAWKTRRVTDGAISGFGVEDLSDLPTSSRVLLVDDICDGGGTFVGLSEAITSQRAQRGAGRLKRDLFTTFGLYTQGHDRLLNSFDHVYCTDLVGPPSYLAYPQDKPHPIVVNTLQKLVDR